MTSQDPHQPASTHRVSILDDWTQEGPDDPEGDAALLAEALALAEQHAQSPIPWTRWEDFKAELSENDA